MPPICNKEALSDHSTYYTSSMVPPGSFTGNSIGVAMHGRKPPFDRSGLRSAVVFVGCGCFETHLHCDLRTDGVYVLVQEAWRRGNDVVLPLWSRARCETRDKQRGTRDGRWEKTKWYICGSLGNVWRAAVHLFCTVRCLYLVLY